VVVNIDSTVNAIQRALEEAELMADCKIKEVYTGHRGQPHQELQLPRHGGDQGQGVSRNRTSLRVIETAKAVNIPTDQQILHVLNQEFIIDGQEDVREPLGMSGVRLEVKVHIVTGAVSAAQNIIKCVRRCGLEVHDLILQPLASACGAHRGREGSRRLRWSTSAAARPTSRCSRRRRDPPHGGHSDCRRPDHQRHRDGAAHADQGRRGHQAEARLRAAQLADPSEMVEVPGVGDRGPRQLSRQTLAEVIEPRVEELYSLVQRELRTQRLRGAAVLGVVITGGSSGDAGHGRAGRGSLPHAGAHRCAALFGRLGRGGAHAALLDRRRSAAGRAGAAPHNELVKMQSASFQQVLERMKSWLTGNF
jgi:cell division protein FtsA